MNPEQLVGAAAVWYGGILLVEALASGDALADTSGLLYMMATLLIIIPGLMFLTGEIELQSGDSPSTLRTWFLYALALALGGAAAVTTAEVAGLISV